MHLADGWRAAEADDDLRRAYYEQNFDDSGWHPITVPGHWRTQFDLAVTSADPVELRCYLRSGDEVLSETWLFQYHPSF